MATLDNRFQSNFSEECRSLLKSGLWSRPYVLRVKRLCLRIKVDGLVNNEKKIASLVAHAFVRELQKALASSGGHELVQADSRSHWLAMAIRDCLAGTASQKWEYQEFTHLFGLSTGDAILELLCAEPEHLVDTLQLLSTDQTLIRVLALFDEVKLETLFGVIGRATGVIDHALSVEHVTAVSRTIIDLDQAIAAGRGTQRVQALTLYLALRQASLTARMQVWSPRLVLHALQTLSFLTTRVRIGLPQEWIAELTRLLEDPGVLQSLRGSVVVVLQNLQDLALHNPAQLMSVLNVLVDLRTEGRVATVDQGRRSDQWISCQYAGLFLLTGLLIRLEWPHAIAQSTLGKVLGPRALTYLLATVGLAIVGKLEPVPTRLDPGLALFAGWTGEADMSGLRDFVSWQDPAIRRELLAALTSGGKGVMEFADSWEATLQYVAGHLIQNLAGRVRGFRQASRAFVVARVLAVPGRIRLGERTIVVTLDANPFHVALHLSSLDETVESVGWLGNRRMEFVLEGL
jgi:hypothetical protein